MNDPIIISCEGWGANPDWSWWAPAYPSETAMMFIVIHYTWTSDGYTDGAEQVRLIHWYHAMVTDDRLGKKPWGAIGYNFLIDRFGNIYEGRIGGPRVIGAHTYRYNTGRIGIGLIGKFKDGVPAATIKALNDLCAYLCWHNQIWPQRATKINGVYRLNIAGHRDYSKTACPGDAIYALLPKVRRETLSLLYRRIKENA